MQTESNNQSGSCPEEYTRENGWKQEGTISVVREIRFSAKNANISDCLSKFKEGLHLT